MAEFETESAESSPASPQTDATSSQATTTPVNGNGQMRGFHDHPDWQRMVGERRTDRDTIQTLQRQIQEINQRQQASQQPSQEEAQKQQAIKALDELIKETEYGKGFQENQTRQFNSTLASGDTRIASFVKDNGLPTTPEFVNGFQMQVGALIKAHPQAEARLRAGDMSIIDEANAHVMKLMAPLRQQSNATLGQTKQNVRNLPPRSAAGTTPGTPAPEKFDPAKESGNSFWEKTLQKARSMSASAAAE